MKMLENAYNSNYTYRTRLIFIVKSTANFSRWPSTAIICITITME